MKPVVQTDSAFSIKTIVRKEVAIQPKTAERIIDKTYACF
ncbi:hypothetical protein M917_1446 [Psychrobacter aquaticus CMS 56]|uniref:Uncharacterized protein n=1 Tax=Psychrobacter aquaticus CMS 56 TaxID=1354303 RepID=U4TAG9_9GAMM|nr:hypothetical protein M917_1446 [Psychrobacter aquaticus CMS 56]